MGCGVWGMGYGVRGMKYSLQSNRWCYVSPSKPRVPTHWLPINPLLHNQQVPLFGVINDRDCGARSVLFFMCSGVERGKSCNWLKPATKEPISPS